MEAGSRLHSVFHSFGIGIRSFGLFFFRLICFHTYAFFCLGSFCGIFLGLLRFCIPCSYGVHVKQDASLVPRKIRLLTTHHCPLRKFIFPVVPTMYCNNSLARAVAIGGCRGRDTSPGKVSCRQIKLEAPGGALGPNMYGCVPLRCCDPRGALYKI